MNIPDHPEIRWAERTGYPSWKQEDDRVYCQECGKDITDEDQYDDAVHTCLCADCLLFFHKIGW